GADDIEQSEDLLLGQSLGATGLVGFRGFRMRIADRVRLEILAEQRILHRPSEKRRKMADPGIDGRLSQSLLFHPDLPRFDMAHENDSHNFLHCSNLMLLPASTNGRNNTVTMP